MIPFEFAQHRFIKCLELLDVGGTVPRMLEQSSGQYVADILRSFGSPMACKPSAKILLDTVNEDGARHGPDVSDV